MPRKNPFPSVFGPIPIRLDAPPRNRALRIAAAALLLLSPVAARAGGWTQPPGHFYAKIETAFRSTDERYDADGARVAIESGLSRATYSSRQVRGYMEMGLLPEFTGTASIAWERLKVEEDAVFYRTEGFSDLRLGARWGILAEPRFVSSLMIEAKIPTGYDSGDFPALGDGDPDAAATLQFGTSFPRGYAAADVGYNVRSGDRANEIPFSLEAGVTAFPKIGLRAVLRGRRAVRSMTENTDPTFDPTQVDSRNIDLAGTVSYAAAPQWDVEAGVTHTLSGRNTLTGTEISVGVAWHR